MCSSVLLAKLATFPRGWCCARGMGLLLLFSGTMLIGCQGQSLRLPPKLSYRGPIEEITANAKPPREKLFPLREGGLIGSRPEDAPRLGERLLASSQKAFAGVGNALSLGLFRREQKMSEPKIPDEIAQQGSVLKDGPIESLPNKTTTTIPDKVASSKEPGKVKPNLLGKVPRNDKDWVPELKILPWAEFGSDSITVKNVRNCEFLTYRDCIVDHYDETYDLKKLKTVDFIVIPFQNNRAIAHTMVSFGFDEGKHVGVSAEVRLENGQSYDAAMGLLGQFELTYVVADERDLIRSRTEHRDVDVYVYRTTATPEAGRKLFIDMMRRVNQLHDTPEFYDTLSNNCTTNIIRHINHLYPDKVPYDYRVLLPGYADRLAYELGLLDNSLPFAEIKRRAHINEIALKYKDSPDFSAKIRGETVQR